MPERRPRARERGKSTRNLELIDVARSILETIQPASVRAVCYQLFVRGLIPNMSKNATNRVGRQLLDARKTGIIPWEWIADDTRTLQGVPQFASAEDYMRRMQVEYRQDRWAQQPRLVVCWSEKSTVYGTLRPVLDQYGVDFLPLHGYNSATIMRETKLASLDWDRPWLVLYVGDYDPDGVYMSEVDLPGRIADLEYGGPGNIEIRRIALTADHTRDLGMTLSFPASDKRTSKRYPFWVQRGFGERCWELDALNPNDLRTTVEQAIRAEIDWAMWNRAEAVERAEAASVREYIDGFPAWMHRRRR